jgi:hypothetical protein
MPVRSQVLAGKSGQKSDDGETELLAVAKAYQDATGFHLVHPELSS